MKVGIVGRGERLRPRQGYRWRKVLDEKWVQIWELPQAPAHWSSSLDTAVGIQLVGGRRKGEAGGRKQQEQAEKPPFKLSSLLNLGALPTGAATA